MNTFQIVRLIGEAPKEFLNGIETSLLTRMAFFGDKDGKNIRPGIEELVRQTKFCKRSIVQALSGLTKKNIITDVSKRGRGSHKVSCYEINVSLLSEKVVFSKEYLKSFKAELKDNYNELPPLSSAPHALDSSAPHALDSSAPHALDNLENENIWCTTCTTSSAPHALDSSAPHAPLPYTPHLEPIKNQSIVEFDANPTFVFSEKESPKISKKKNWKIEIGEVFDYWRKVMNRERSKIDKKRTAKIISALEHGFTVDELKRAVDGAKSSPFHRGQNDRGVIYDSIDLIFRNPEKIETFICILGTQASPKNKNVSTGLKLGFVERQKSQVNMLRKMGDKYFPHLSDNPKVENNVTNLLTSRQENKVNEQK